MERVTKYVVFYSTRCKYSVKLLEIIEKNGLENSFNKINIDFTDDIPNFVTHVPTVLVDKGTKISGQEVFEWVKKLTEKQSFEPISINQSSDPYSFISNQSGDQHIHQDYSLIGHDYGGGPSAGKVKAPIQSNDYSKGKNGSDGDFMQKIIDNRSNEVPQMIRRV